MFKAIVFVAYILITGLALAQLPTWGQDFMLIPAWVLGFVILSITPSRKARKCAPKNHPQSGW